MKKLLSILTLAFLLPAPVLAALDLSRVAVERLDNGMTLLVLEDNTLPVVSTQMAYKVGGRDDPEGLMGIAHFFEHMAFRSAKNFPDTGLVSEIYGVGGEWHGYTWIDQTTYFATAPKENLDLLLRIEADRMNNLDLDPDVVEAEFGAVLTEMNSYENDPSTILYDAVLATVFQAHPYGKNTIGYEGDIAAVTHEDLVSFYEKHIRPNKAVLAVVGDVKRDEVARRVKKLFGRAKPGEPASLPPASEPYVPGEKRVRLIGAAGEEKIFKIAFPAPAASSGDFPAFLILQEALAGGSGVNFRQNEWGTPARHGSPLAKAAPGASTFFIVTAQPYVFMINGSAGATSDEAAIEKAVQNALDRLADAPLSAEMLEAARKGVMRELALDIETTEDAAHQLAIFESIGALETLLQLEERLAAVTATDVMRAARTYLNANRRTIGWYVPSTEETPALAPPPAELALAAPRAGAPAPEAQMPAPVVSALDSGAPLIIQRSPLSPGAQVKLILAGRLACAPCSTDKPIAGYTSVNISGLGAEIDALIDRAKDAAESAASLKQEAPSSNDPATRLEEILASRFVTQSAASEVGPALMVISGDVNPAEAARLANAAFGGEAAGAKPAVSLTLSNDPVAAKIAEKKSQAALGYMVPAPALDDDAAPAWRLALYILSHHYEGRLGKEAISRRGLVYYIAADYRASPAAGLVTLAAGVDPDKQEAMKALMEAEIARLLSEPPTEKELAEAKRHLIGRRLSEAQSNSEIADALAREWLAFGRLRSLEDYAEAVNAVALEDLHAVLPAFTEGDIVSVTVGE